MAEIALTPTDEKIILAVHRYHYLTREQIARLLHLNVTHTNVVLRKLIEHEYLARCERPAVSFKYLYLLDKQGIRYLKRVHEIEARLESRNLTYLFQVPHLLQVNEAMMCIEQFAQSSSTIALSDVVHDYTLRLDTLSARPDVWASLHVGTEPLRLWIEVDRGTEEETKIKEKVMRIVDCISKEWQRGRPTHILFLVVSNQQRLKTIYKWIQEILNTLNIKGKTFRVAYLDEGALYHNDVFFEPIWYQPFEEGRKPLLYR
jgi:DNA-binding MarR family transcriptional regulator